MPDWKKDITSNELQLGIDNAKADGVKGWDTLGFALNEARYIIGTFSEGGHANYESLHSDNPDERLYAQQELWALKKFVSKWSKRKVS